MRDPRNFFACLIGLTMTCIATAGPTSSPTSKPATVQGQLMNGSIRFDVAPDWKEIARLEDGTNVTYRFAEPDTQITIYVTPTNTVIEKSTRGRMAKVIAKGTEDGLKNAGHTVISPPTLVRDETYFMKLRSTYQLKGAQHPTEQLALYRTIGLTMASATVMTTTDSTERRDEVFAIAGKVVDSFRSAKLIKPTGFPKARVWVMPPIDWTETKTDAQAGLIVTYRDPREPGNVVRVEVRPMTKEAKADTGVRQKLIETLLAARDKQLEAEGVNAPVDKPVPADAKYLVKTAFEFGDNATVRRVETRVLVVGETLAAVTSIAPVESAADVAKVAESLAGAMKPIERK